MAQYGKNPPWANQPQGMASAAGAQGVGLVSMAQQQMGMTQPILSQPGIANTAVYSMGSTQPSLAQQQYTQQMVASVQNAALQQAVLPQPGIAIPTSLASSQVATVSYPAPRAAVTGAPQAQKQRVFTGSVTKLHDNFGFVDEDVFFQVSCVKGTLPKLGDRVLVEAIYNANMPFKWNATRIQVLPNQATVGPTGPGTMNMGFVVAQQQAMIPQRNQVNIGPAVTPSITSNISSSVLSGPPPLMAQHPHSSLQGGAGHGSQGAVRGRMDRGAGHFRDRESRDRPAGRDRDRHDRRRSPAPARKRSRSPVRRSPSSRRSPSRSNRRAARIVPRYMVQIPKLSLDTKEVNVMAMKSRYTNLYIPSDFFQSTYSWTEAFPLHRPFQLGHSCSFHIMNKEAESIEPNTADFEPADADHLYSAKVMLLSCPSLEELYHKSCALTEDPTDVRDAFQHPTRLIQFMVGLKGKSEPMAIGGPWSPSLDGASPTEDPSVLINTAIRTTRALTGIDLSVCTQWYRFAEVHYHRPEEVHKGRVVPSRVETVVIFLPDVWNCTPTRLEWEGIQGTYKKLLMDKIATENPEEAQDEEDSDRGAGVTKDPTHYLELDPKTMKVGDLRNELESRTLSAKGLKSQLIARLTKALRSEQENADEVAAEEQKEKETKEVKEEEDKIDVDEKEEEKRKKEEEEKKRKDKELACLEKKYALPDNPAVVVHPSATAKGGKFDCTVMSLSVLLDYRPEDNKEHSFEVSMFAEMFNEMLMRDFGFRIYKTLLAAPERKKEEDKEKRKDKKDKKDKEDKEDKDKEEKNEVKDEKSDEEPGSKKRKTEEKDSKDDRKAFTYTEKDSKDDKKHEDEAGDQGEDNDESEGDTSVKEGDGKDKDKKKDKKEDKKREKVQYYTALPDLLMAFVYFDQSHTGYLMDKDVEEILQTLGLLVSRSQGKKLVQRLISRDTLNYRKLTDKPKVKEGEEEGEEGKEETATEEEALPDEEMLALGNRELLANARNPLDASKEAKSPSKAGRRDRRADDKAEASSNLISYMGALVDINSIMQRLDKSEAERTTLEGKFKDLQDEMDNVKESFSSSEQNSKKVVSELKELKKKLREQRRLTERGEESSAKFKETLTRLHKVLQDSTTSVEDVLGSDAAIVKREEGLTVKQEVVPNGE